MRAKHFFSALLALMLAVNCTAGPVSAAACTEDTAAISRATGRLDYSIPADTCVPIGDTFYLNSGDKVSYNCTYSPASASMDFGVIAPDGKIHYISGTNGSINQSIKVSESGQYQLVVCNNESYPVTVNGTVKY